MLQEKMSIRELMSKRSTEKRVIEYGEDKLHKAVSAKFVDGTKKVLAGIDSGSTQNRVTLVDDEESEDIMTQYVIPSTMNTYDSNLEITPASSFIYDNMDSYVMNLNKGERSRFTKERVLRGKKLEDSGIGGMRMNSIAKKVRLPEFYINIIDALAYGIIQRANEHGLNVYKRYEVYAGVSLPPQDMLSEKDRNFFTASILGEYLWSNKDLGIDNMQICIKAVESVTEPESEARAYLTLEDKDYTTIMLIEAGGKNIGVEVLKNGVSVKSVSDTIASGGTKLSTNLCKAYAMETGKNKPSEVMMNAAIKSGFLRDGKEVSNITPLVIKEKQAFGKKVFEDVFKILQNQDDIMPTSIECVLFSGRLFFPGDYDYSISQKIIEEFKPYSPKSEFVRLQQNYIPVGNLIIAYDAFGGYVFPESPDVEEVVQVIPDIKEQLIDESVEEKHEPVIESLEEVAATVKEEVAPVVELNENDSTFSDINVEIENINE